jgi:hypothetical protein
MLEKLWAGDMSEEEYSREMVALSLTFDDESAIAVADLDAGKRLDWEVVGPESYPSIFRKERGLSLRPPLAWELTLMEACLRALPAFVSRHKVHDMSAHKMTIPVATGELSLRLSWVEN